MTNNKVIPNYEALDASGKPFIRPASIVGELPHSNRRAALDEALQTVAEAIDLKPSKKISFGLQIYTSFGMTLAEAKKHVHSSILLRQGCDLSLQFIPKYMAQA